MSLTQGDTAPYCTTWCSSDGNVLWWWGLRGLHVIDERMVPVFWHKSVGILSNDKSCTFDCWTKPARGSKKPLLRSCFSDPAEGVICFTTIFTKKSNVKVPGRRYSPDDSCINLKSSDNWNRYEISVSAHKASHSDWQLGSIGTRVHEVSPFFCGHFLRKALWTSRCRFRNGCGSSRHGGRNTSAFARSPQDGER